MYETQKSTLEHITSLTPYRTGQYMVIDTSTRRNLELVETMREKQKRGTLLWAVSYTHLDVYKRQLWFRAVFWLWQASWCGSSGCFTVCP